MNNNTVMKNRNPVLTFTSNKLKFLYPTNKLSYVFFYDRIKL